MHLETDAERFDHYQQILMRELIEQIRFKLYEAGLRGERLKDAVVSTAFSVASTLDDTARVESDGVEVRPYITFRSDEATLIDCGENSYMHEYVTSLVDEVFSH
ncbi:MAG: hypothetical protein ACQETD_00910 [Pseudomonadota bacterium]